MQKIRLFYWLVLEILLIIKACNLLGWEHFGPYLRNQNFSKYGICAGTQQIIKIFVVEQIQQKLMTKYFNIFKKSCFWPIFPIFGAKKFFLGHLTLSGTTSYGFLALHQNLEKTNDKIPRKQPDRQKVRWKDRRRDGRMDRPYFIGPFQLLGVQKGAHLTKVTLSSCFKCGALIIIRICSLQPQSTDNISNFYFTLFLCLGDLANVFLSTLEYQKYNYYPPS